MSLHRNLYNAERAVRYVETYLRNKAINRPEDLVHQLQRGLKPAKYREVIGRYQTLEDLHKSPILHVHYEMWDKLRGLERREDLVEWAAMIRKMRVGNCNEHAVLAADYLVNEVGISENVFVVSTDGVFGYLDHVWVMIDLNPEPAEGVHFVPLNATPPLGADAVVCDAWYNEWYAVQQDWSRKIQSVLRVTTHKKDRSLPFNATLKFQKMGRRR